MGVPSFPVIRPGGEPLPEELQGVAALAAAATTGFVVRTGEATYAARPAAIADIEGLSGVLDAIEHLPDPTGQNGLYLTVAGDQYVLGDFAATHDHDADYQPLDATLTALAGLDATAGLLEQTGADTFTRRALGVGAAGSVLTRGDGDSRYVTLGTTQTITGLKTFSAQVVVTHSADTYHYPYISLRRSLGTTASPLPLQSGTIVGGVNAYGYYNGEWNWSIGAALFVAGPTGIAGPTGRYVVSVSTGAGTGTVTDVISGTTDGVTLHKPTTVQGRLSATGGLDVTGPLPEAWTTAGVYHGTEAGTPRSVYSLGAGAPRWLVDHGTDGSYRWVRETGPGEGTVEMSLLSGASPRAYARGQLHAAGGLKIGAESVAGQVWTAADGEGNGEWADPTPRVDSLTPEPTDPAPGDLWVDPAGPTLRVYSGGQWVALTGGDAGPDPGPDPATVTLDALPDDRLYQRSIGGESAPIALAGTYAGEPTAIECRVLLAADDSTVVDWSELDSPTLEGGAWSGTLTVPQGGPYRVEARPASNPSAAVADTATWSVGAIAVWYGQSNSLNHFQAATDPPGAATGTWYYDPTDGWGTVPAADGIRNFLNDWGAALGCPVGAVNGGQSGVNIAALVPGTANCDTLLARLDASGGGAELICWHHGEGDGNTANPSGATYLAALDSIHGAIADAAGRTRAECPLICSGLGRAVGGSFTGPDSSWWTIQAALRTCNDSYAAIHYSHSNYDAALTDSVHWDGASYGRSGRRYAATAAHVAGLAASRPSGFVVASAEQVDGTTTDVTLTHGMGADFVPTSGITGFEVSGDNGATWGAATGARQSATVVRLTHSDLGSEADRQIRYHYGKAPDVSAPVLDDSPLAVPLVHTAGRSIAAAGSGSLPAPTWRGAVEIAANGTAVHSAAGLDAGDGTVDRLLILAGTLGSSRLLNGCTVTPAGGPTLAATIHLTSSTGGEPSGFVASVAVPAGTAGDLADCTVSLTWASTPFSSTALALWTVPAADLQSATPTGTGTARAATATAVSADVAASAGGFVIAVASTLAYAAAGSEITGPVALAERSDAGISGQRTCAADASGLAGGTATLTATWPAANHCRIALAAWR